jgi:hypothetical protein
MTGMRVYVSGVGVWSPQLTGLDSLQRWLAGDAPDAAPGRPPATMLPSNERRRAPDSVLLAIEVAGQAVTMSGQNPAELACVFSSSHGDQPITDYMCETLARAPAELSPIRFHNSVHNAAAGYWTIATGCHAASTAISAQRASFGAGLLEAACQVLTEQRPLLLVCSDTAGCGPLTAITGCHVPFGCALVLTPAADAHTIARLDLGVHPGSITATPSSAPIPDDWIDQNASAPALPLLALLAAHRTRTGSCRLMVADALGMDIHMETSV